ncbi:MAG: hypothetical protein RSG52_12940 [Terrisporobacter sp.]|uniref:hypothetical protein n=1 Tax=Terrisporobacter sp. TaxID=1965305 RepID=UPI002FCAF996
MKGKNKRDFSSNDFILFLYISFSIIVMSVWIYQLFITKQYGIGMVLLFWEIIFSIAYFLFVKD